MKDIKQIAKRNKDFYWQGVATGVIGAFLYFIIAAAITC